MDNDHKKDKIYAEGINSNGVSPMLFSSDMIKDIYVTTFDLHTEVASAQEQIKKIKDEILRIRLPFKINYEDTFAYTLIDGLSKSKAF